MFFFSLLFVVYPKNCRLAFTIFTIFTIFYAGSTRDSARRQEVSPLAKAEHIALVCILFSRLKEPPQLLQPLTSALPNALLQSGKGLAGTRIISTSSAQTSNRFVVLHLHCAILLILRTFVSHCLGMLNI